MNAVRDALISALCDNFPDIEVYGEQIKQELKEPCFFVRLIAPAQDRELGRRYKRYHPFDVHYFAKSNEDAHAMAERLFECLEYIEVGGGKVRGDKLRYEIIDGVLHFFVSYDFHVVRPAAPSPTMNQLSQDSGLIGE